MCDAALSPEDKLYQEVSTALQESCYLSPVYHRTGTEEVYTGDRVEIPAAHDTGPQWPFKEEQLREWLKRACPWQQHSRHWVGEEVTGLGTVLNATDSGPNPLDVQTASICSGHTP